jgi:hypothetical protein
MSADEFAVPDLALPGPASIRRAVLRGILRSGFAAAAWLLVAALLAGFAAMGLSAVRTGHFHDIAFYGAQVGRPGYVMEGGPCCSEGLFANRIDFGLTVRGGIPVAPPVRGSVRQGISGSIVPDLPPAAATPVGAALDRRRPTKDATRAFLGSLPPSVTASAIVEFASPPTTSGYLSFEIRPGEPADLGERVFLADPYGDTPATWEVHDVRSFGDWVHGLSPDDDRVLSDLGAPPVSALRKAAKDPRVHAVVLERASVAELRALLADDRVASLNIAGVAFDPAAQSPTN